MRRRWVLVAVAAAVIAAIIVAGIFYARRPSARADLNVPAKPEAPPDLAKLRDRFVSGLDAIQRKDGPAAVERFSSFRFGPRAVEDYRLYYLANAYQLTANNVGARRTLAQLWGRNPRLIYADEATLRLIALHAAAGASRQAADVAARLAVRTDNANVAAAARWQEIDQRLATGDVAGVVHAAQRIVIASPRSGQADDAIALLRAMWSLPPAASLHLTSEERLERAVCLMRDGDPQDAFGELTALEPSAPESLKQPIVLNRGLALFQLRRFADAIVVLEHLTSSSYKFAIPALYHLSKSYRALANSIDPTVYKTITEKKKVNVKVRVGKGKNAKVVSQPRIVTTKRTIKLIDAAKLTTKESYDRLATERLKDLLQLPLAKPVRIEVLSTLIVIAEAKNDDEYEQQLLRDLVKLDPLSDAALQHFWDKAWTAYVRGDLQAARTLFHFINDTYSNPNVKRQSDYWYARTVERQGQKEEAHATYQRLASAPYLDLYAINSVARGATRQENQTNPLKKNGPDWSEIAEEEMPSELRLAYELTALADMREARLEIQKNIRPENDRFAQALLADLYNSSGAPVLMQRAVKRAFPQIATVEQDSAPSYFLRMYYPVKYQDEIKKYSGRNGLDPYLVMGLILQESSFIPTAKSAVGATGLMQLMPPTAKELARRLRIPFGGLRLENPVVNIELGTLHLKMLVNMFGGNALLAVASYNAGQGNVLKWKRAARGAPQDELIESIPYAETRNYVKRVAMLRSSYARIAQ